MYYFIILIIFLYQIYSSKKIHITLCYISVIYYFIILIIFLYQIYSSKNYKSLYLCYISVMYYFIILIIFLYQIYSSKKLHITLFVSCVFYWVWLSGLTYVTHSRSYSAAVNMYIRSELSPANSVI